MYTHTDTQTLLHINNQIHTRSAYSHTAMYPHIYKAQSEGGYKGMPPPVLYKSDKTISFVVLFFFTCYGQQQHHVFRMAIHII